MRRNLIEAVMGAVVLAVAGLFLAFAYETADLGAVEGYEVAASFDRADGVGPGTEVRMSGIKIGTVVASSLDPERYDADVRMAIRTGVAIPDDSSASIASDGLLGDNFVNLSPGGSDTPLAPGARIVATQGSVDLMGLLGKMLFSQAEGDGAGR